MLYSTWRFYFHFHRAYYELVYNTAKQIPVYQCIHVYTINRAQTKRGSSWNSTFAPKFSKVI